MGHILRKVLDQMIEIYKPMDIDWMNYALTKNNKYTYHHILEKKNGGKIDVDNGAILTIYSHRFLHFLEKMCPDAYNDLQSLFSRINASKAPMSSDDIDEVNSIVYRVLNGEYEMDKSVDLVKLRYSEYLKYYCDYDNIKKIHRK